jgi:hypothetical protein
MNELDTKGKLKTYAEILNSLYSEGIIRTYNSPVGDYAEWIVSEKLGLELEKNSKAGFDALGKDGSRYQVKSRWKHPKKNNRQLNVIRDYDTNPFDYVVAVIFGVDFDVEEAYQIPYEIIGEYFPYNKHQNGIVITLTKRFLSDPRIEDIKEKLM